MDRIEPIKVTRQELYDRIWSMPMSRACRIYGFSDVGLAKICAEWKIPRPARGYWAKLQHGQKLPQKELPTIEEGNPVVFSYMPHPDGGTEPERGPKRETTESDRRRDIEKRRENLITVAEELTDPHPLVAKTATSIRGSKPDEKGIVRPKARKCLDLSVSPALIDRSLRILDAILKALEARSLRVTAIDGDVPRTQVRVLDEDIRFGLSEETVREERLPTAREIEWDLRWKPDKKFYQSVPSGKLALRIVNGNGCWSDRSARRVEDCLNFFVVALFRAAEGIKAGRIAEEKRLQEEAERRVREQEEAAQRARERQEQEKRRQEMEKRQREEQARREHLDREVASWVKSQQTRAYLVALRTFLAERGGFEPESNADRWLRWADGYADWLDPLTPKPPPDEKVNRE